MLEVKQEAIPYVFRKEDIIDTHKLQIDTDVFADSRKRNHTSSDRIVVDRPAAQGLRRPVVVLDGVAVLILQAPQSFQLK